MSDQNRITELLQPYLNEGQFYVVDVQVVGNPGDGQSTGRMKVSILLDSDVGITIEECASISRRLGATLDEADIFGGAAFTLEVSSPGVDQPLRFRRQYVRNVGRQLAVTLLSGVALTGRLESVADEAIVLDVVPVKKTKKKKSIPAQEDAPVDEASEPVGSTPILFADIKHANVEISFK
ncbi:MAG: ribosome maturation factor RimP [Bacteroidetes bacterium]|nr:ribosome maturation factor RimP [Fibrella sp.]